MKIRAPVQFCQKNLYITTIYTYLNPIIDFSMFFLTNKTILNR